MGFIYDWRSTATTPTATCASGEVSRRPSYYRGEQYDSDLGLYYLRARYYNPGQVGSCREIRWMAMQLNRQHSTGIFMWAAIL